MPSSPHATVLVLNFNGESHLEACLTSLQALDYPNTTLTVVDNGSSDGSVAYVKRAHPNVRVLEMGRNRGFAAAYNAAVEQTQSELVAILNNDTHVDSRWLTELVSTLERHHAAAASSAIVDWDGSRIDFAGVLPTFLGHAWQVDYGEPVGKSYPERQLLFGCGGSMLIRRDAFLRSGGFDEDFFAYFEDVDLGWRLTLFDERTYFSPRAITYHRLHGTNRAWPHALRLRLYERNALATIYKNYGDDALQRVLPAAVALTLARAAHHGGFDSAAIQFGASVPAAGSVPGSVIATLIALEDFARWLPALGAKRRAIQERRSVDDRTLFQLFPDPLRLHEVSDRYRDAAATLIRDFRIADLFGLPSPLPPVAVPAPPRPPAISVDGDNISVVVLTASGARHLPACLDSLRAHHWPAARTDVIVVDNGSPDDPTAVIEQHYPGARVLRTGRNLGFAAGNNAGARIARGEWIVFLNDDTRVAPDWLDELMAVARRRRAASVAALIVDWNGEHVDFGGGLVSFEARGYSVAHGLPVSAAGLQEEPILFGCGAAVMFRRDVFEDTGGWDEGTFAYYEDVEIGWRLWLLGHEVWFAPSARVLHKHHGTSGSASAARTRALERNAFRMLYTHLEQATLDRALVGAVLLAADRVLLGTPFSRASEGATPFSTLTRRIRPHLIATRLLHALSQRGARRQLGVVRNLRIVGVRGLLGSAVDATRDLVAGWEAVGARDQYLFERVSPAAAAARIETVPIALIAALMGFEDFVAAIPSLSVKRAWLQANRRRSDADVFKLFGKHWASGVPSAHQDLHDALRADLVAFLELRAAPRG